MNGSHFALVELGLTFFGIIAFAWWQFRTLKRDRAITEARMNERSDATRHSERQ